MQLQELHQQVDDKLFKLDNEIQRFESNIAACDEPEQRNLLEKDLATLQVIKEKLLKAKGITQQVNDLRQQVENPQPVLTPWQKRAGLTGVAVAAILLAGFAWITLN